MQLTFPAFGDEEIEYLRRCLASGWVTQGPYVDEFEKSFAERHASRHALATTSCTAALHLAAAALELGPGDEVIVPAFTWVTSAHCARYMGAEVRFVDIDPRTFNLDPAKLLDAISERTRAVVVVHLFGLAADMEPILKITQPRGIAVIEDAACAIGTSYRGRPVGTLGDLGCFSFHPRKVVTTGEGGMVSTGDDELARRVRALRNHGATGPEPEEVEPHGPWTMARFEVLGFNLRMSDIQAAVGVAQLQRLDGLLAERHAAALRYHELLASLPDLESPIEGTDGAGHTYQSYVIRLTEGGRLRRNRIMAHLAERSIQTRPGTHAVHCLGYYRERYGLSAEDFPFARDAEDTTITLPLFPGIGESDQQQVVEALHTALSRVN